MGMVGYIRNLVRDPNVASIAPSSTYAIKRTCKNVDFANAKVVVEYGPGGGCFTEYFLRRMPKDSTFVAFETNAGFAAQLRKTIPDSRLIVIERSAELIKEELETRALGKANYILSGIPFSMIPDEEKNRILQNTAEALAPEGRFLTYQFVPPMASFDRFLKRPMEQYLEVIRVEYELLNIPPLRIYESKAKR